MPSPLYPARFHYPNEPRKPVQITMTHLQTLEYTQGCLFCGSLFPSIVLGEVYSHCFTSDATAFLIFTTLVCDQWSTRSKNLSYETIPFICLVTVTKGLACGPSMTTLIALQKLGGICPPRMLKILQLLYC
jgi:hypothetical protein